MSRSYRKPYLGNSSGSKEWKRAANRKIRRELDTGDGACYKKYNDVWISPMESAHGYWDVPGMRRK